MNQTKQEDQRKPLWYDESNFKDFREAYERENAKVLLFVGSGLSISAGFPNWRGLLERIRDEAGEFIKVGDDFDEKLNAGKYHEAGSALKKAFDVQKAHRNAWREILKRILKDPTKTRNTPQVLKILCELKWDMIITTNYDQLVELAYKDNCREELKVYHPWTTGLDESLGETEKFIFKIHGDIGDDDSRIVLSTEEYKELYQGKEHKKFREVLKHLLGSASVILFLGFSYEDRYFKRLFNTLYRKTDKPQKYFALFNYPGPSESGRFNSKIRELAKSLGIRYISYRNRANKHEEFLEFLEYLKDRKRFDAMYSSTSMKKRATVVLLYTGGTIGATRMPGEHYKEDELDLHRVPSRFDPWLQEISDLLQRRFRQFYNTGSEFQFELKWEILPQNQQILSENATVEHWNNLVSKVKEIIHKYLTGPSLKTEQSTISESEPHGPALRKIYEREKREYRFVYQEGDLNENEFLEDIEDRYIAGIVVLHGTDTLASAAAAFAVGLNNLPFPIVVTGANRPPDEKALLEKGTLFSKSDTWKNLVTSLYFLQCFGHRFTETFVCFGDTIHHGMNLRKTTIETAPLKRAGASHQDIEPFLFRNASINKQYLFRLIDGVFCNNCYPIGKLPYTELIKTTYKDLRHVRQNPFQEETGKTLETFRFESTVAFIAVSPSFPHIDVKQMVEKEPRIRAVLVEGYKSGTYPTIESNHFTQFISDLYESGIPVILVAHYGITTTQERYETLKIGRREIPVLRLYGMIPETALPLLCRVVSSIDRDDWETRGRGSIVKDRVRLITIELKKLFKETNNIVSIEFGDITDQKARGERITENSGAGGAVDNGKNSLDRTVAQSLSIDPARLPPPQEISEDPDDSVVIIPRADFLWNWSEVIKPVEKVGSAPDGFAILADMGFEWGFKEFHQLCLNEVPRRRTTPFFECTPSDRRRVKSNGNKMLGLAVKALEMRGIAYFGADEIEIHIDEPLSNDASQTSSFSFKILIRRRNEPIRGDEKYNVQSYSQLEADFFRELNNGPKTLNGDDPLDPEIRRASNEKHVETLANQYSELMESSWQCQTGSFDWYILGVFKGFTCALAWYFLFDHWSENHERNRDAGYDKAMQQSVKCNIVQGNESFFEFEMTYFGWYEHN